MTTQARTASPLAVDPQAIDRLRSSLQGPLLRPGDPDYDAAWSGFSRARLP